MNRCRFSIPNDIWKWNLKPQGFAILVYLHYLHVHCKNFIAPSADEIAFRLHMSKDMATEQFSELNHRGLLNQNKVPMFECAHRNFFYLPNELFFLNIGHGAITVYAYLLYCEDRHTHKCHPSYLTISGAVHLTVSTVMKHIAKLVDRQFISVENTTYIDKHGMKWNGNNLYTILPIQMAVNHCYQQQLLRLEAQSARVPGCEALCTLLLGRAESFPFHQGPSGWIWAAFKGQKKKRDKGKASTSTPLPITSARSAGSFRGFWKHRKWGQKQRGKEVLRSLSLNAYSHKEKAGVKPRKGGHYEHKREISSLPFARKKGDP